MRIYSVGCAECAETGYHPNMGLREQTEFYFGKRVREERERRGWRQDELARRLTDKGIDVFASTIAKIESQRKPRAVRLAEAAGIADLFGVSLDSLLGRQTGADDDMAYALRALLDSTRQGIQQISVVAGTLHSRVTELDRFEFDGRENLQEGVLQVTAALTMALGSMVSLSTFDLPPAAASAAPLKEAMDREGVEALTAAFALVEEKGANEAQS